MQPNSPSPLKDLARRTGRTVAATLALVAHTVDRVHGLATALDRDGRRVAADVAALVDALRRAAHEVDRTLGAAPRIGRILRQLTRLGAAWQWHLLRTPFLSPERRASTEDAFHQREAARFRAFAETMGGGILKVAQNLASRPDLMPEPWIAALVELHDRAPAAPPDALAPRLEALRALGYDIEPEPFAAASMAQVHRATTADGQLAAIKLLRPGIAEIIEADQRILRLIADQLADRIAGLDLAPWLREIAASLSEELDLAEEARHAEAFAAIVGPGVRVPEVIAPPMKDALIMAHVAGRRLSDALADGDAGIRDHLLGTLARTCIDGLLVHGRLHGDPHPGNFLVVEHDDGAPPTLVMLDFGAAIVLTAAERRAWVGLLPALLGGNTVVAAHLLAELGFSAPDPETPVRLARETLAAILPANLATIDPRRELELGLARMRANPGLVVPGHFVRISRALATLSGLFLTHRPRIDLPALVFGALTRAAIAPTNDTQES
jgi:ubiquinone biosynthesis protein